MAILILPSPEVGIEGFYQGCSVCSANPGSINPCLFTRERLRKVMNFQQFKAELPSIQTECRVYIHLTLPETSPKSPPFSNRRLWNPQNERPKSQKKNIHFSGAIGNIKFWGTWFFSYKLDTCLASDVRWSDSKLKKNIRSKIGPLVGS